MAFLSWEQAVDLAEAMMDRYRALIYLAVDSGMRWSELVGLRRAGVDLQRKKVRVTEQLIRLEAGEWLRKETKTAAGVRSITISVATAEILADHIERFCEPGPDALVFPNKAGNPIISSSFWQHYFQPALRAAEVSCRFHDLRHTSVALAIAGGAHPKAIQTRRAHRAKAVVLRPDFRGRCDASEDDRPRLLRRPRPPEGRAGYSGGRGAPRPTRGRGPHRARGGRPSRSTVGATDEAAALDVAPARTGRARPARCRPRPPGRAASDLALPPTDTGGQPRRLRVVAGTARSLGALAASSDPHLLDVCRDEGLAVLPLPGSDGRTWSP